MQQNIIGSQNWMEFIPQMQIMFDQLNDAVFIIDQAGKILVLNQSAAKLTGYSISEMVGKPIEAFVLGHPKVSHTEIHRINPTHPIISDVSEINGFPKFKTKILAKVGSQIAVEVTHVHFSGSLNISCIIARNLSDQILSETMREINSTLSSSLKQEEVYDLLLVELNKLIPYDGSNVMLLRDQTLRVTRTCGYEKYGKEVAEIANHFYFNIGDIGELKDALDKHEPIIVNDIDAFPNWINNHSPVQFRSWLGCPIVIDNKVDAIISLDKVEPNYFTQEHASILTIFSNQAASAIKNARLYEEEVKRIHQLDGLQSTLAAINSQLELKTLLNEIVDRAIDLLGASIGELAMYDPDQDRLKILVSHNFKEEYTDQIIQSNKDILNHVATTKKPIKFDRFSESMEFFQNTPFLGEHSGMAVPLLMGEKVLGVLAIADLQSDKSFSESDITLLNSFAQQATIAINNSKLFEDANRRAEEAETMRKVGSVVTSSLNQGQAINSILEQLALVIPYDSAAVLLQRKDNLNVVGNQGFSPLYQLQGKKIPLSSKNPATDVYQNKRPIIITDLAETYPNFLKDSGMDSEIKSWLGAPLIIKKRCLGILSLHSNEVDHFNKDHLRLISTFADHVAIALENAQLYTDTARAADRFMTLYQLSQIISTNIRTADIYPSIHEAVSELMETEFFSISLYDSASKIITDVYMVDNGKPQQLTTRPLEKGLFSKVLINGKSILFHSFNSAAAEEMGAVMVGDNSTSDISQSILVVPLKIGSKIIGVISAQSYKPNMYNSADRETLELLAANVAIAIENARLFDEVQRLAITDPLTQLYNRRKFEESASKEFERSLRYNRPLCAIMIDLDQFKQINDTYGHLAGDQVLTSLADLCKNNLRNIDILARYGGEEFVILLPETTAAQGLLTAERLRQDSESNEVETSQGSIAMTISLGLAELNITCKTLEELVDRADQALFESKRTGRNKSTVWSPRIRNNFHSHSKPT